MADTIEYCERDIFERSLVLKEDSQCFERGARRNINLTPPARRGQTAGDSIIYEHVLEFARQLRSANFSNVILFLSSNTRDYCRDGSRILIQSIQEDFDAVHITFQLHWDAAVADLGLLKSP